MVYSLTNLLTHHSGPFHTHADKIKKHFFLQTKTVLWLKPAFKVEKQDGKEWLRLKATVKLPLLCPLSKSLNPQLL